jgi:hypothetical protein
MENRGLQIITKVSRALLGSEAQSQSFNQRFTRRQDNRETPYIVAGNGGHAIRSLTRHGSPASRIPTVLPSLSNGKDQIVYENYDDTEFGYLRVIVDSKQLRLEYHPASDGDAAKTPDDFVTVDLATHRMVHYQPGDSAGKGERRDR